MARPGHYRKAFNGELIQGPILAEHEDQWSVTGMLVGWGVVKTQDAQVEGLSFERVHASGWRGC
jgi:hypothetical protein